MRSSPKLLALPWLLAIVVIARPAVADLGWVDAPTNSASLKHGAVSLLGGASIGRGARNSAADLDFMNTRIDAAISLSWQKATVPLFGASLKLYTPILTTFDSRTYVGLGPTFLYSSAATGARPTLDVAVSPQLRYLWAPFTMFGFMLQAGADTFVWRKYRDTELPRQSTAVHVSWTAAAGLSFATE